MSGKKGKKKTSKPGNRSRKKGDQRLPMSMAQRALRRVERVLFDEEASDDAIYEAYDQLTRMEHKYILPVRYYELLIAAVQRLDLGFTYVLRTLERGVESFPDDADLLYNLGVAYLDCHYFLHCRAVLARLLERWPDHSQAEAARAEIEHLDEHFPQLLAENELEWPRDQELAYRAEKVRRHLQRGEWADVVTAARSVLAERPELTSVRNNLARALWERGEPARAIEEQRTSLEHDPMRPAGVANIIRFLTLSGRFDEARHWGKRAESLQREGPDSGVAILEIAAFLGKDEEIVRLVESAGESEIRALRAARPDVPLIIGTAYLRCGDPAGARRWWSEAGGSSYVDVESERRLAELDRPEGDRNAPWYLDSYNLIPNAVAEKFRQAVSLEQTAEAREAVRPVVEAYPEVTGMVPYLLSDGDDTGRSLALLIADVVGSEDVLQMVFRFTQQGEARAEHRDQAMSVLSRHGSFSLPSDEFRETVGEALLDGAESERSAGSSVTIQSYEIVFEQMQSVPEEIEQLSQEGYAELNAGRLDRAESLLSRALEIRDDVPSVWQNLIATYEMQGKKKKAYRLLGEIHERFPDYAFARFGIAIREAAVRKNPEYARELVAPIMQRSRLHVTEFTGLCHAMCHIAIMERDTELAYRWYEMWKEATPDDRRLENFRMLEAFGKLVMSRKRRSRRHSGAHRYDEA